MWAGWCASVNLNGHGGRASALRHPRHAQALIGPFAPCEVRRMVASRAGAIAADRETRMKLKARPCCSACLTQLTKVRQCSGKIEVRYGIISVGLDGPSQP